MDKGLCICLQRLLPLIILFLFWREIQNEIIFFRGNNKNRIGKTFGPSIVCKFGPFRFIQCTSHWVLGLYHKQIRKSNPQVAQALVWEEKEKRRKSDRDTRRGEQTSSSDHVGGVKIINYYNTSQDMQSNCFLQFGNRCAGVTLERKLAHEVRFLPGAPSQTMT